MILKQSFVLILEKLVRFRAECINRRNRRRLVNRTPTLITSDCTGGILCNWLGLKFNSPFINCYLDNNDFMTALENFDEFMAGDIVEETNGTLPYPVGIGIHGERIHFMHYPDFETAATKWHERKQRIDKRNMGVILSNLGEGLSSDSEKKQIVERFRKLNFKHKIILSGEAPQIPQMVRLKGFVPRLHKNICYTDRYGRRFIDRFDYVGFINSFLKS